MAHSNAANLADNIPECVKGCFDNGVAATGCDDSDYDCWCYDKNHQTIVDTMYECLDNRERRLNKTCSNEEMFEMENNYWKICEQYWEDYGTATQPASAKLATATTTKSGASTETTAASVIASPSSATAAASSFASIMASSASRSSQPSSSPEVEISGDESRGNQEITESDGLSTGAKAGIAIGVTLAVLLVAAMVFLLLRERKKRKKLEDQVTALTTLGEKGGMYPPQQYYVEMPGSQPYVGELRGDTSARELSATPLPGKEGSVRETSQGQS